MNIVRSLTLSRESSEKVDLPNWRSWPNLTSAQQRLADVEAALAADQAKLPAAQAATDAAAAQLEEAEILRLVERNTQAALDKAKADHDQAAGKLRTLQARITVGGRDAERLRHLVVTAETEARASVRTTVRAAYAAAIERLARALIVAADASAEVDRIHQYARGQDPDPLTTPMGLINESWRDLSMTREHGASYGRLLRWLQDVVKEGYLPEGWAPPAGTIIAFGTPWRPNVDPPV